MVSVIGDQQTAIIMISPRVKKNNGALIAKGSGFMKP